MYGYNASHDEREIVCVCVFFFVARNESLVSKNTLSSLQEVPVVFFSGMNVRCCLSTETVAH